MKRVFGMWTVMLLIFAITGTSNAALWDRGGGLIYDSDQDLTWLQDANFAAGSIFDDGDSSTDGKMTWDNAVAWADTLEYGGYDDWRLPESVDGPFSSGYDGTTIVGYNITSSEMGYMYYEILGNLGYYATDGTFPQFGYGLNHTAEFLNLLPMNYWSATEVEVTDNTSAYTFHMGYGGNVRADKLPHFFYAWAVRDGDSSPVPIPSAVWLLGSGLIGLVGFRRKFRKG